MLCVRHTAVKRILKQGPDRACLDRPGIPVRIPACYLGATFEFCLRHANVLQCDGHAKGARQFIHAAGGIFLTESPGNTGHCVWCSQGVVGERMWQHYRMGLRVREVVAAPEGMTELVM